MKVKILSNYLVFMVALLGLPAFANQVAEESQQVPQLFEKGITLLRANKPCDAQGYFQKAIRIAPKEPSLYCNLGLASQNCGDPKAAVSYYLRALELQPGMSEATLNLAGCYQCLGDYDLAAKYYKAYIAQNPNSKDLIGVKERLVAVSKMSKNKEGEEEADYFKEVTKEGLYHWLFSPVPIKVFVVEDSSLKSYKPLYRNLLMNSFDQWSKALSGKLKFEVVDKQADAQIVCSFTEDPKAVTYQGASSERGLSSVSVNGKNIYLAKICILLSPVLLGASIDDAVVEKACLHEIGHVLGLQGHSAKNTDIMFATVDSATVQPSLSTRDINTVRRLYGEPLN